MVLSLSLKKHWFQMIESGYKKEDYRDITPYYIRRIGYNINSITEVVFSDFYRVMRFEVESITIGSPNPLWTFNPDRTVYIIRLGKRIL